MYVYLYIIYSSYIVRLGTTWWHCLSNSYGFWHSWRVCTVVYVLVALMVVLCLLLQDVVLCCCIYVIAWAGLHVGGEPCRKNAIYEMEEVYGTRIFIVYQW